MTVYNIPYDQRTDPKALFTQGFGNMMGGLMQGRQMRRLGEFAGDMDPEDTAMQIVAAALSRGISPQIAMGLGGLQQRSTQGLGVLPGLWNIASPEQKKGYLNRWGGMNTAEPTPLSEPQVGAYGEAMDSRLKRIDRFWGGIFGKDFTEKDLFREWQKFNGMYKFKNDKQREQVWNLFKNKIDNLGTKADWDPEDPKWREEIGLRAETRTGDNIRMQSAPDIELDPYWDDMTDEDKKTAWEHLDGGGSVEDIINLLK